MHSAQVVKERVRRSEVHAQELDSRLTKVRERERSGGFVYHREVKYTLPCLQEMEERVALQRKLEEETVERLEADQERTR